MGLFIDQIASEMNPRAGFPGLPAVQDRRIVRQGLYRLYMSNIFLLTFCQVFRMALN